MKHLAEAAFALLILGSPVVVPTVLLALTERDDGQTRWVIVGGKVRRR